MEYLEHELRFGQFGKEPHVAVLLLRGKTTQHTLRWFLDEAPSDIHVHGRVRAVRAGLVCSHVLGVRWFCGRPIQWALLERWIGF